MADTSEKAGTSAAIALPVAAVSMLFCAALLSARNLVALVPFDGWRDAIFLANGGASELVFSEMAVPRIAVSLLVGAGLSFSGALLQHLLRNPLADATTLGVSSGAYLAVTACTVFAPFLLDRGQEIVALLGAFLAVLVVGFVAARARFSPVTVLLAGLSVNLLCGSASAMLAVLNHELLTGVFIWQGGSLVQTGWASARALSVYFAILACLALLIVRPLSVLELGDDQAKAMGVPVSALRVAVLAIAVVFSGLAVSHVGIIGFLGMAVPNLARILGARTLLRRLSWSAVLGALLLWLADQVFQSGLLFSTSVPAGAAMSLLGGPLMLVLVARMRLGLSEREPATSPVSGARTGRSTSAAVAIVSLVLLAGISIFVGKGLHGWTVLAGDDLAAIIPWRAPRVAASLSCGAMLGFAGTLMQRMTGNPMASPEVMGISAGASLAVIAAAVTLPNLDPVYWPVAAAVGALITLAALFLLAGRSGFSGSHVLLIGIALATLMTAATSVVLTSGDPRAAALLAWMSGSTYSVTATSAIAASLAAIGAAAVLPLFSRWIEILPLGTASATAVGINVPLARSMILLTIGLLTTIATLTVGPLSFVGLLAPHIARGIGARRGLSQAFAAGLAGALIMVVADWLGRNLLFPWQVPAGLIASSVGVPCLLFLLRRYPA